MFRLIICAGYLGALLAERHFHLIHIGPNSIAIKVVQLIIAASEADMVASPLSITQERKNAVTFSSSLYKDSLGLISTRPEGRQNNEALFAPFTNT
ncbi:hypothetical protein TNIN_484431, partial [Trichonephila inaurata madagascariensis]